ncbi:ArdC family protein [Gimesia chilikensis]|uniref:DNA primase TraC n=1 Tax=Gimesia chilikensis TaxID=2605989 RepID=A0A517PYF9_9PLAN|nr:zincin-like metallopeptidase domain-containing protein [Gimesia chilikensis]QDT24411.1 DNA primase TraC [Gimesia chilikensis]
MSNNNQKIREEITNQIISALERGSLPPWRKPWSCDRNAGMPKNVVSGDLYSGVNPLLLGLACERHGFQSRHWGTYKQWEQFGGKVMRRPSHVSKGQWGTKIVFCKAITKKKEHEEEETYFLLRTYTVFNIDQIEGDHLDHYRVGHNIDTRNEDSNFYEEADELIAATEADIRHGGNQAYYDIPRDYIQVPNRDQFSGTGYYETLFHELVHWTENRLNWDREGNGYALGELIAEIGACYLCSELNIPMNDENHHAYLDGWLQKMKQDSSFIFKASSQASRATDYLMSFKPAGVSC